MSSCFSGVTVLSDYKRPSNVPKEHDYRESTYLLPSEVAIHNKQTDCWVSYNGYVYDLTELCDRWSCTKEIKPLLAFAGKDISDWFDHEKDDIKHYVHPVTGVRVPYCPHGPIPDLPNCVVPSSTWRPLTKCPWWLDDRYKLGKLTKNARPCRIINVLTGSHCVITVCEEDTINRIRERAELFNDNGENYTWKFEGKDIDMTKTLSENNIPDERERYVACGLPEDFYIPSLMCYFNDEDDIDVCRRLECRKDPCNYTIINTR